MKRNATISTGTNPTDSSKGHVAQYEKVLDGRKRPVRGLWRRNVRFYAQLTVTDPGTGRNKVQRIPLVQKEGNPVGSVAEAVAVMEGLRTKRRETGLEAQNRRSAKFADYLKTYLDANSAGEGAKKHRVVINERAALGNWSRHFGDMRLDQIRKVHVNDFTTKRLKQGRSPRTCNLDVVVLRNVLKRAVEDGLLPALPIIGIKPLKTTRHERRLVPLADVDTICRAALNIRRDDAGNSVPVTKNGQEFADYLRFLQFTGAREKEALLVRWADVDFDREQLTIGAEGDTKNRSGRFVDMNSHLKAHLLAMWNRRAPDSQWLFPSPQRGAQDIPARTFRESLNLVRTAAGKPGFGFHDLRHHFVSMAVMSGIDFMTIAKWVGHRDGGVLIGKVYGHLADEHRREMASRLNFSPVILSRQAAA